jgi:hypothetical protein
MSMIGNVTRARYDELVAKGRELVEAQTRSQFALGDNALEIEPLRQRGGGHSGPGEELLGVSESLQMYADDIDVPYNTIKDYRWIVSRWPARTRRSGIAFSVYRILAGISDEQERHARLGRPPLNERTGERRWTMDAARREVGRQVGHPVSVQEKIEAVHDLARDEEVASAVATDLLRRPDVAFRAMGDNTARHLVNRAQIDRAQQAGQVVRQQAGPALRRMEHNLGFVDLIGSCAAFVAAIGRIVPTLRGHEFSDDELATIHKNVARVRSTTDWIESAVDSGSVTMDEGLARLLRGE